MTIINMLSDLANYGDSDEEGSHVDTKYEIKANKRIKITIPKLMAEDEEVVNKTIVKKEVASSTVCKLLCLLPEPQSISLKETAQNIMQTNGKKIVAASELASKILDKKLEPNNDIYECEGADDKFSNSDYEEFIEEDDKTTDTKQNTNYLFISDDTLDNDFKAIKVDKTISSCEKMHLNIVYNSIDNAKFNSNNTLKENLLEDISNVRSNFQSLNDIQPSTSHDKDSDEFDHFIELHKFMPKKDRSTFRTLPSSLETMQTYANGAIEFIDASADDILAPQEVQRNLTKAISTEHPPDLSKFKKDITQQQKRKHQITYLAYQAKEREYELQKQWASSKATRQESRAKYGF